MNKQRSEQCCDSRCASAAAAPRSQIITGTGLRARRWKALQPLAKRAQAMADRDDAMDVGAIEDDALNDDDDQNEDGDEVEEGYKMV